MSDARPGGAGRWLNERVLLLAVVTVFAVEALRTSGPVLDHVAGAGGVPSAALAALLVYLSPALLAPLVRWWGAGRATVAAVLLLAGFRLVAQLEHGPGFVVMLGLVLCALSALVLLVDQVARPVDPTAGVPVGPAAGRPGTVLSGGGVPVAVGIALGGALDVAVRGAFGTWDPVWRDGFPGWLYTALAVLALLGLLARTRRGLRAAALPRGVVRFGVLGLYLALYVLILGSPAFLASQSGLGLPSAVVVLLVGGLLGIEAVSRLRLPGGSGRLPELSGRLAGGLAGLVLALAVLVVLVGHGLLVVPVLLLGQVAAVLVLARACTGPEAGPGAGAARVEPVEQADPGPGGVSVAAAGGRPGPVRPARLRPRPPKPAEPAPLPEPPVLVGYLSAGIGLGLGFVLVVLLYQMTYELPLPFDNRVLPVAAAVLLALVGLGRRPSGGSTDGSDGATTAGSGPDARPERPARRGRFAPLAGVPAVLLLVPVLMLATTPAPAAASRSADTLRLVTWNLHYGVDNDAVVDPGAIARVLRAQHPDVVLLQEVDRGWPIGGGTDLAEWLSRSLAMPYVWSPAADGQFGNVILSSLPLSDVDTGQLPYGAGPQHRSYASAKVELASGRKVRVMTAHLQDHTDNHPTRLAQIGVLLRHWNHANPAVIAGDFNSMPGWPEIQRFDGAGLVSAQDTAGRTGLLSSPTDRPKYRPDWIFGTPDVSFSDFAMPDTKASDHFPLAVTVQLG